MLNLKKFFFFFLFFFILKAEFKIEIWPTFQNRDIWYNVVRAPQIVPISSVVKNQLFDVFIFFSGYELDYNNNVDISYDIRIFDPNGKETDTSLDLVGRRGKAKKGLLLLNGQYVKFILDDNYTLGKYTIKVKAYDKISQKTATAKFVINLRDFNFQDFRKRKWSEKEVSKFLKYYYDKRPSPEESISFMFHSLKTVTRTTLTKTPLLYALKRIFETDSSLANYLIEFFSLFSNNEKKQIAFLSGLLNNDKLLSFIEEKESQLVKFARDAEKIKFFPLYQDVKVGYHLDRLWAEFLVFGTYEPIAHIIKTLSLYKYYDIIKKIKNGELDKNDPNVKKQALLSAVFHAATWSIKSNIKQHPLVKNYCYYALRDKKLSKEVKYILSSLLKSLQKGK